MEAPWTLSALDLQRASCADHLGGCWHHRSTEKHSKDRKAVAFLRILGILHWRIQNRIPLKVLLTDGDEAAALGALWARLEFSSVSLSCSVPLGDLLCLKTARSKDTDIPEEEGHMMGEGGEGE